MEPKVSFSQLMTIRYLINEGETLDNLHMSAAGWVRFTSDSEDRRILRDGTVQEMGGWRTILSREDMGRGG